MTNREVLLTGLMQIVDCARRAHDATEDAANDDEPAVRYVRGQLMRIAQKLCACMDCIGIAELGGRVDETVFNVTIRTPYSPGGPI